MEDKFQCETDSLIADQHQSKLQPKINPRPYPCTDCNVAFRILGHLAKHLRSKTHVQKLEAQQKLPFGTYAEIGRAGVSLAGINTTNCESALASLKQLAQTVMNQDSNRKFISENDDILKCNRTVTKCKSGHRYKGRLCQHSQPKGRVVFQRGNNRSASLATYRQQSLSSSDVFPMGSNGIAPAPEINCIDQFSLLPSTNLPYKLNAQNYRSEVCPSSVVLQSFQVRMDLPSERITILPNHIEKHY